MKESPIDKYCERMAYKKAVEIDEKMAIVLKPRPSWCPKWLYHEIIKDSIEIVDVK